MPIPLLTIVALITATPEGKCDAKPFTLKKPEATASAKPSPAKPAAQAEAKTTAPNRKPKPKIAIGCKQPAKSSG